MTITTASQAPSSTLGPTLFMCEVAFAEIGPVMPRVDKPSRCADRGAMSELGPGAVVAGRYLIEAEIGVGGMGVVHRAR